MSNDYWETQSYYDTISYVEGVPSKNDEMNLYREHYILGYP